MLNIFQELPAGAHVAVIRLRSLGDCVLTTPAIEILHKSRPDVKIGIVVETRFAAVFEGNPALHAVIPPRRRNLLRWKPQLCLNLHGGTRSLGLALSSGAPMRAGFAHYRYSFVHNIRIPTAQLILGVSRKVHTAEHLAAAMFYLGCPQMEIPPARLFVPGSSPIPGFSSEPYAVIHPFASASDKTWSAARFADLAVAVKNKCGLQPIFIGGPADDMGAFDGHRTVSGAPLSEVKALIQGARLFIGNDSGPAHMAAAFQVPSLVIFGSSDPEVWAPWKTHSEMIVAGQGIASLAVDAVWRSVERLKVAA